MGGWREVILSADEVEDDVQFRNTDSAHSQAVQKERWKEPENLIGHCRTERRSSATLTEGVSHHTFFFFASNALSQGLSAPS